MYEGYKAKNAVVLPMMLTGAIYTAYLFISWISSPAIFDAFIYRYTTIIWKTLFLSRFLGNFDFKKTLQN